MAVLVTCIYKEDSIKNEGTRVVIRLYIDFSRCSRASSCVVSDGIWSKFKYIQALIVVLVICKNEEEDPIKSKLLEWPQHFSRHKFMCIFQDAQGHVTQQSVVGSGRI